MNNDRPLLSFPKTDNQLWVCKCSGQIHVWIEASGIIQPGQERGTCGASDHRTRSWALETFQLQGTEKEFASSGFKMVGFNLTAITFWASTPVCMHVEVHMPVYVITHEHAHTLHTNHTTCTHTHTYTDIHTYTHTQTYTFHDGPVGRESPNRVSEVTLLIP